LVCRKTMREAHALWWSEAQRKVSSVGIALIGDSKVATLEEPTSGMARIRVVSQALDLAHHPKKQEGWRHSDGNSLHGPGCSLSSRRQNRPHG
jgi:hypothetical protein